MSPQDKLRIDGFPELYRNGPVHKRTRGGGPEIREEKDMEAAMAASRAAAAAEDEEPVILEGQVPVDWKSEARAAPPRAPRPAPRAARRALPHHPRVRAVKGIQVHD